MKKVLMGVLAMGTMITAANAACSSTGCYDVTVDRLYTSGAGTIYVGTNGDENSLACESPGGVYMTVPATAVGKNALYSMLLTAQTTGKKINIRVAGGAGCNILYATIDR